MKRLMEVKKTVAYKFVEEPMDGTRYSHLIQVVDNVAYVTQDMHTHGSGLKNPQYFMLHDLKRLEDDWEKTKGNPYIYAEAIKDLAERAGENQFTYASAMRCAYRAFRMEGIA